MSDMLLALDLFCEQLQQLLEVVVEILFESVDHAVIVVLHNAVLDVLTLKQNSLLSAGDCVHQVSVVLLICLIVEFILIQEVLIFSQEVVNLGLAIFTASSSIILSA